MNECFALTFLPPPEPDIFGGERGGEEEEKAEREISKPLPLSSSLSLSLSLGAPCVRRAYEYDFYEDRRRFFLSFLCSMLIKICLCLSLSLPLSLSLSLSLRVSHQSCSKTCSNWELYWNATLFERCSIWDRSLIA